jgi:hypothetical protein
VGSREYDNKFSSLVRREETDQYRIVLVERLKKPFGTAWNDIKADFMELSYDEVRRIELVKDRAHFQDLCSF